MELSSFLKAEIIFVFFLSAFTAQCSSIAPCCTGLNAMPPPSVINPDLILKNLSERAHFVENPDRYKSLVNSMSGLLRTPWERHIFKEFLKSDKAMDRFARSNDRFQYKCNSIIEFVDNLSDFIKESMEENDFSREATRNRIRNLESLKANCMTPNANSSYTIKLLKSEEFKNYPYADEYINALSPIVETEFPSIVDDAMESLQKFITGINDGCIINVSAAKVQLQGKLKKYQYLVPALKALLSEAELKELNEFINSDAAIEKFINYYSEIEKNAETLCDMLDTSFRYIKKGEFSIQEVKNHIANLKTMKVSFTTHNSDYIKMKKFLTSDEAKIFSKFVKELSKFEKSIENELPLIADEAMQRIESFIGDLCEDSRENSIMGIMEKYPNLINNYLVTNGLEIVKKSASKHIKFTVWEMGSSYIESLLKCERYYVDACESWSEQITKLCDIAEKLPGEEGETYVSQVKDFEAKIHDNFLSKSLTIPEPLKEFVMPTYSFPEEKEEDSTQYKVEYELAFTECEKALNLLHMALSKLASQLHDATENVVAIFLPRLEILNKEVRFGNLRCT